MSQADSLVQLLRGNTDDDGEALDELVTRLWAKHSKMLYWEVKQRHPVEASDIIASGFAKFVAALNRGAINASSRDELFVILRRMIRDKVCEHTRKEVRRNDLVRVYSESDRPKGTESDVQFEELVESEEVPADYRLLIEDVLRIVDEPRLQRVVVLKLEDLDRSNVSIARQLHLSDREIGRRLARAAASLTQRCEWFREQSELRTPSTKPTR